MHVSEARIRANQANALKSSGPKSEAGKEQSRRNGLKHGLAGSGIVLPEGDQAEIDRRAESLLADLKPKSPTGQMMILRMAMLSVRIERAGWHELAAIAYNVRHAAEEFDEERLTRAETLFDELGDNPWGHLRRLRKSPEGVDRLIHGWRELREDLTREGSASWTAGQMEQAVIMTGTRGVNARSTRIGALSEGVWGDFRALGPSDGGNLSAEARRNWCRARLVERIDAEIAGLEAHRETLDLEMIAQDRAEAGSRALFDPSKKATLARRYESEASRGYYKALKEFRQAEAEFEAREVAPPAPSFAPPPPYSDPTMGSDRDWDVEDDEEPDDELIAMANRVMTILHKTDGPVSEVDRPRNHPVPGR